MKTGLLFLVLCLSFKESQSQKTRFGLFTLHNIIRGDSVYNTFDKQVAFIKTAGYEGIEINGVESFDGMKAALDKHDYKGSYFYVRVSLEEPYFDSRLEDCIRRLKGSNTIISPYITASRSYPRGSRGGDTLAIRLLRQLSDWSEASGLQVAVYPHFGDYVERTDHALALVKSAGRRNVGLAFNLCHWLATTTMEERSNLKMHLRALRPYVKMITISGANNVITQQKTPWDDYILPLGEGSFDTYGMVRYCVKDLKMKVPIGVQCYNIKADKVQLVQNTMQVWKRYQERL